MSSKDGKNGGGRDGVSTAGDGDERKGSDYEVGYCRPPKHTRWKKGCKSPNPEGRPKKAKPDVVTILDRLMSQPVRIREGDITRELPADQAADLAQMIEAMKGDQAAFGAVIRRMVKLKIAVPAALDSKPLGLLLVRDQVPKDEWGQMLEAVRDRQAKLHAEGYEAYFRRGSNDE